MARPSLLINLFGGSVGGPIKKNKAFFFANYEGRRDASATSINRNVPTENLKQGIVTFHDTSGALKTIGPAEIKAPWIRSASASTRPRSPCSSSIRWATTARSATARTSPATRSTRPSTASRTPTPPSSITRLDNNGKESLFWRGNLQNDHAAGTPQFPGAPPNTTQLSNNKGMAAGLTSVLRSNLVSSFRYGYTREGGETSGISRPTT